MRMTRVVGVRRAANRRGLPSARASIPAPCLPAVAGTAAFTRLARLRACKESRARPEPAAASDARSTRSTRPFAHGQAGFAARRPVPCRSRTRWKA
ncbi:hypothetical protein GCM10009416_44480 [Craurococcus roseus]|uniref:Uncharacterized protein n=1 Tax=Craurococcus roseus TaxID=77585 RepID=A0ABP3R612_9PROT